MHILRPTTTKQSEKKTKKIAKFSRWSNTIDKPTMTEITRNVKGMMMHRVGGVAVESSSNLFIAHMIDIRTVGIYANYLMITKALNGVFFQLFTAISAGIGNLGAAKDKNKSYQLFKNIYLYNFWIYSFASVSFFYLVNPFINLFFGKEFCFNIWTVSVITLNFYVQGMRQSVLTFKESHGLNWYDRYKPLGDVTLSIGLSVCLGQHFGLTGIFSALLISRLLFCIWIEAYVIYKHAFGRNLFKYFLLYLRNFAIMGIITAMAGLIINFMPKINISGLLFGRITVGSALDFFVTAAVCLIIPNLSLFLIFRKSDAVSYFKTNILTTLTAMTKRIIVKGEKTQ